MELRERAIEYLRDLRISYEQKEKLADLKFVKSCFEIIKSTDGFQNKLDLIISDELVYTSTENGKILFNMECLNDESLCVLEGFEDLYMPNKKKDALNYVTMLSLLHECAHAWYDLLLDPSEEVNILYYEFAKKKLEHNILYRFFGDCFSFERHANIDTHKVLIDVYADSPLGKISKTYYLDLLTFLYGRLSPTEKTQIMLLIGKHFTYGKVDIMKRLEVGFPMEKETMKKIDNELIREARGEIDFYEFKKSLRRITSGIR